MITQQEFDENVSNIKNLSDFRDEVEVMTKDLIDKNSELVGLCLMLFSWNFANMRQMLKTFSILKFREVLKEINPTFKKIKNERFETADFEKLRSDISFIYNKLCPLLQQTGTTKTMYFKNPNLFVMWDMSIRKFWKVPQTKSTADDYINFLKLMQKEFSHITWQNKEISFARAIDMYNFVVTQKINKSKIKT